MKINIACNYTCRVKETVELPEAHSWADITSWGMKWGTFFYTVKGDKTQYEVQTEFDSTDAIDWKHHEDGTLKIHPVDINDTIDESTVLDED